MNKNPLIPALILMLCAVSIQAAHHTADHPDAAQIAAVTTADAERMAATMTGDRSRLEAILSDELRYAHSNGNVDTKKSLIDTLVAQSIVYESFDYQTRNFLPVGPEGMLMSGRVLIHAKVKDQPVVVDLNFLSVWRKEHGHWRFLGWQSCSNPNPAK